MRFPWIACKFKGLHLSLQFFEDSFSLSGDIRLNVTKDFYFQDSILRVLFQEGESFSCLLFLVYGEYEKVPRWIWSPSVRHIYQVFSCGLHISSLDRNW